MSEFHAYIDSAPEQEAWLINWFGPVGSWTVTSQQLETGAGGALTELMIVEGRDHVPTSVRFDEASPDFTLEGAGVDRTGEMDAVMLKAAEFAAANPPHHPGAMPRFPVPSKSYADALDIPLPIRARDDEGGIGLYAPARYVSIRRGSMELIGVGEFPGFDPDRWPPERIGDWPPIGLTGIPPEQIQAKVSCFSACWSRVLETWFDRRDDPPVSFRWDVRAALDLRAQLDVEAFSRVYSALNPVFADWLHQFSG